MTRQRAKAIRGIRIGRGALAAAMPSPPSTILLSLCLLATIAPAHAQSSAPDGLPTTELAPVKVTATAHQAPNGPGVGYVATRSDTATKTDMPIARTPQAISVVTQLQLQQQQPKNIPQALRYTPGVTTELYGTDGGGNWVQIRGFDAYDSIFLDGLQSDNGTWTYQLEPYGLQRLEVLKGPSSMLYGQNEPGGLVNAVSKRPTDTPQHEITAQTGSYGEKQIGLDSSGPVAGTDGRLDYRIVAMDRQTGTQVHDTDNNRQYIAPSLTWKPDASTQLTILADYLRVREPGWTGPYLPVEGTLYPNPNGQISRSTFPGVSGFDGYKMDQEAIGWELDHEFTDALKFTQNFRYNHINGLSQDAYGIGLEADDKTWDRATFSAKVMINSVNMDNHIEYDVATGALHHKILVGVDYRHLAEDYTDAAGTASSIDIYDPAATPNVAAVPVVYSSTNQVLDQVGEYIQDEASWGGWQVTAGARHDNADTATRDKLAGTSTDQDDGAWTWRAALLYAFENGVAPYVSYATSFLPTSGTDYAGNAFQPTRGKQYEVGLKYKPAGINALLTAALFDLTETNALTEDPAHAFYDVQTGRMRSRGLELEAKASPFPGLDLDAAYTYDDAVIVRDTEYAGNAMPTVPKHAASLWVYYRIQQSAAKGLGVGAGIRYESGYFGDDANDYHLPPVTLLDMMVDYDLGHLAPKLQGLGLQVNASNLLNTTYVTKCFVFGAPSCMYGAGRTIYATAAYRW